MALFETLVVLLLAALPLLAAAHRFGLPYPTLLVSAGALAAALPFAPRVDIDPKLALVLFVAPALMLAAYEANPRELYRHRVPLFMLAIMAVLVTTAAVATLGHLAADLPLAAAVALGAIVAPPDAAASGAVLSAVGLPRRAQMLLEGESLLNDASSLLLYGFAVALAAPDQAESGPLTLSLAVPGGVVLGLAAGWTWIRTAPVFKGSLGFNMADILATFGVWLLADGMHLSPVLAVVAFGMLAARHLTRWQAARDRVQGTAVWRALVLALNATAFLLLGHQARGILAGMSADERTRASIFAFPASHGEVGAQELQDAVVIEVPSADADHVASPWNGAARPALPSAGGHLAASQSPPATQARPATAPGETGSPRTVAPSSRAVTGLSDRNTDTRVADS